MKNKPVQLLENLVKGKGRKHTLKTITPNIKGSGFRLFSLKRDLFEKATATQNIVIGCGIFFCGLIIFMGLVSQHSTPDFIILVGALLALCGLVVYDVTARRKWERQVTNHLKTITHNYDRLVREVARNRTDVSIIKEGLGKTAMMVEKQGRKLTPSGSVESKMIETMVEQLSEMGTRPRVTIEKLTENDDILEMEMAAPPKRPEPITDIDAEIGDDFSKFSDDSTLELLKYAVRNDKIDIFMQPVVTLPQRKTRMIEMYGRLRLKGGTYVPASKYLPLAKREKLIPAIDNLLLIRSLQMMRTRKYKDSTIPYVINISNLTLNDRGFMGDLVTFLSGDKEMAKRLIFELSQDDIENMNKGTAAILDGLAQLGCQFSMDQVTKGNLDTNLLKSRHIRFIKLDAAWLLREGGSSEGYSRILRMKKQLDSQGIDLIVEKIESEDALRELLDFNIDYGQGYLFGKPDHQAAYEETLKVA